MKSHSKTIKALPEYLQPKILSAVAYVNECAPNLNKAVERINTLHSQLSEKEIMWVMSLLTFEKLLDMVKDSPEFTDHSKAMKARTIQLNIAKVQSVMSIQQRTAYAVLKAISIMKRASALSSIISVAMRVQCNANVIGLISLERWLSITSAEYTSLKD